MPYSQTCLMTNDKLKRYVEISSRIRQYLEWEDHKAHESFSPKRLDYHIKYKLRGLQTHLSQFSRNGSG